MRLFGRVKGAKTPPSSVNYDEGKPLSFGGKLAPLPLNA
jgi:hypothetical protein